MDPVANLQQHWQERERSTIVRNRVIGCIALVLGLWVVSALTRHGTSVPPESEAAFVAPEAAIVDPDASSYTERHFPGFSLRLPGHPDASESSLEFAKGRVAIFPARGPIVVSWAGGDALDDADLAKMFADQVSGVDIQESKARPLTDSDGNAVATREGVMQDGTSIVISGIACSGRRISLLSTSELVQATLVKSFHCSGLAIPDDALGQIHADIDLPGFALISKNVGQQTLTDGKCVIELREIAQTAAILMLEPEIVRTLLGNKVTAVEILKRAGVRTLFRARDNEGAPVQGWIGYLDCGPHHILVTALAGADADLGAATAAFSSMRCRADEPPAVRTL